MDADISINCELAASLLNSASKVETKGLRDMGLLPLPALLGVCSEGEGMAGEPALLRKGLLEERLRVRPGDGRRSVDKGRLDYPQDLFSSPLTKVKQAIKEPYLRLTAPRA